MTVPFTRPRPYLASLLITGLTVGLACTSHLAATAGQSGDVTGAVLHPSASTSAVTAFVGATIIDGNGGPPLHDATLIVRGEHIETIGPRVSTAIPQGARVISATGKFIMPGMIVTNYNLVIDAFRRTPGFYTGPWKDYLDQFPALAVQGLQMALVHGVTTVRSSYGPFQPYQQARAAITSGDRIGARFLFAGNIVGWGGPFSKTFLTGLPFVRDWMNREQISDWMRRFNDMFTVGTGEDLMTMSPESLRVAMEAYLDRGPDFIKYGATYHGNTTPVFSPQQQAVIVQAAHRRGKVAETHAFGITAKRDAILAGIDLMQHPEIDGLDDELIKLLVEHHVICSINFARYNLGSITEQNIRRLIQGGCAVSIATDGMLPGPPDPDTAMATGGKQFFGLLFAALQDAVRLGMTPAQVIVAVTKHGAMACGALDKYGTLETGKYADLLVLDADPYTDIMNVRALSLVMKQGQVIDRDRLPSHPVYDMGH